MTDRDNVIKSLDIIGNSREVVAFLRDVAGCPSMQEEMSRDGFEGFSRILDHVNEELLQAVNLLQSH